MAEYKEATKREACIANLRGLLNYHRLVKEAIGVHSGKHCGKEGFCPAEFSMDIYEESLVEAIRCIGIVHGIKYEEEENGERI